MLQVPPLSRLVIIPVLPEFSVTTGDDSHHYLLSDAERTIYQGIAHPKRRAQFLAGRVAAKTALAALGIDQARGDKTAIGRGLRGEPLFPEGIVGSISHGGERAGALLALSRDFLRIGFDIQEFNPLVNPDELTATNNYIHRLISRITHPQEQSQILSQLSGFDLPTIKVLIFSAKEAAYKSFSERHPPLKDLITSWLPELNQLTVSNNSTVLSGSFLCNDNLVMTQLSQKNNEV